MVRLVLTLALITENEIATCQTLPVGGQRIPLLRLDTYLTLSFGWIGWLLFEFLDGIVQLLYLLLIYFIQLPLLIGHLIFNFLSRLYDIDFLEKGFWHYDNFKAFRALYSVRLSEAVYKALFNAGYFQEVYNTHWAELVAWAALQFHEVAELTHTVVACWFGVLLLHWLYKWVAVPGILHSSNCLHGRFDPFIQGTMDRDF